MEMWDALERKGVLQEIDKVVRELLPEYVSESVDTES